MMNVTTRLVLVAGFLVVSGDVFLAPSAVGQGYAQYSNMSQCDAIKAQYESQIADMARAHSQCLASYPADSSRTGPGEEVGSQSVGPTCSREQCQRYHTALYFTLPAQENRQHSFCVEQVSARAAQCNSTVSAMKGEYDSSVTQYKHYCGPDRFYSAQNCAVMQGNVTFNRNKLHSAKAQCGDDTSDDDSDSGN